MYISRGKNHKSVLAADEAAAQAQEPEVQDTEEASAEEAQDVEVAPEATDIVFETNDVADLLAEVTGEDVVADAAEDGSGVTFTIGDDEYTVEPDGDEEILESSRKMLKGKTAVKASRKVARRAVPARKTAVKSSTNVVRRIARRK